MNPAWHLTGFAHECARKACLSTGWVPKCLGHDFTVASEAMIEVAIALDPRAGRFPVASWASRFPAIDEWRPDHRYERTGTSRSRPVVEAVEQGRKGLDQVLLALVMAGELDLESGR